MVDYMSSTHAEGLRAARILVVDDDVDILTVISLFLREQGADVATADNAQDALHRIQVSPPEVLVLDLMMPGMSGAELMVRLREMGLHVPTIVITADTEAPRKLRRDGQEGMLLKPFAMAELAEAIIRLRARTRPWQA